MRNFLKTTIAALALGAMALPAATQERPATILVLDASGSMWGQIDGVNKISIAREVVADILADFPADQDLGFVAYGHRERGQCNDIQTIIAPAQGTATEIIGIVNELNPRGMTPMTDAVIAAAEALRHTEQAATVILVSDGIETCNPDPCAAARALAQSGIDFTTHVIGFDVKGEAEALLQMQCLAEETGGRFITADNAQELSAALQEVVTAPALPVETEVTMVAVMGSAKGPEIETPVIWTFDLDGDGFEVEENPGVVELAPGRWTVSGYHAALEVEQSVDLTIVEGQPQTHVMVFDEPKKQLPAASVSAPAEVLVGTAFAVTWQAEGLEPRDYVTIVPQGAKEGSYTDYDRLDGGKTEAKLRAPSEPGLYEVRLQTTGEGKVLASTPIEVVDANVTVSAPAQVIVGAPFPVSWQAPDLYPRDYVTIVPVGAKEGAYEDYDRIEGKSEGALRASSEPGLYEVRFQMEGSGRVLAVTPVEVVDAQVSVTAPAQIVVGSEFAVSWEAKGLNPRDYVTIVPAGAKEGAYESYQRIEGKSEDRLRAPAEPGLYEVRFQMEGSGRVLAMTPVEVVEGDVSVSGPQKVRAGTKIAVSWTGAIYPRDYVTIVPADADEGSYGSYVRVEKASEGELKVPDEPGLYEIRYHLDQKTRVMARQPIEVVAADAPMDDGAGLVVPASAKPGETIIVNWSGGSESADQRVALARADQADFSWISAESAIGRNSLEVTLPDAPGTYEVRFLDVSGRSVLGRSMIEVQP